MLFESRTAKPKIRLRSGRNPFLFLQIYEKFHAEKQKYQLEQRFEHEALDRFPNLFEEVPMSETQPPETKSLTAQKPKSNLHPPYINWEPWWEPFLKYIEEHPRLKKRSCIHNFYLSKQSEMPETATLKRFENAMNRRLERHNKSAPSTKVAQ